MKSKKILSILLAVLMLLSLAACGGKDKGGSGEEKAETITLGKNTAVFKGYTLTKDEDGRDAMVLTYDYTNNGKEEQSFAWAFLYEATQAGEDLGSPWYDENGNQMVANYEEKIPKGKTLEVKIALALVNTTDDVTILFSDFDDHEYTQTIKLSGSGASLGSGSGKKDGALEEAGSYELYEMTHEGNVFDYDFMVSADFDLYTMELSADGTGWLKIDEQAGITWGDGKITVDGSGAVYTYEYKDGMITLTESTGESMTFRKAGTLNVPGGNAGSTDQTAYQAYWNGDWYGWTIYGNGTNQYEGLNDFTWDCMAQIEIDENGEGRLLLWDEATSPDKARAEVPIRVSDGGFEQGQLVSQEGGWFSDGDVGYADWMVEPDGLGYENLIYIEGSYTDPEDFFSGYDYNIYLRPWGLDWADIEEEQPDGLPNRYYEWYLPAIQSGAAMPEKVGGDYVSSPSGGGSGSQNGEQPPASASDADGLVDTETLRSALKWVRKEAVRDETPYEEVMAKFGNVPGIPQVDSSNWKEGRKHPYKWTDGDGHSVTVQFHLPENGVEIYDGNVSWAPSDLAD